MIRLEEITLKNVTAVCELDVFEEQKHFVAPNTVSLAEAYATRNDGYFVMPFAVYDNQFLIGFVMIGYGTLEEGEPEVANDNYLIWRFMITKEHQNKGYTKPILDEVIKYVKTEPAGTANKIWLSYEPENEHAKRLYQQYGFVENGEVSGGELVAVLSL